MYVNSTGRIVEIVEKTDSKAGNDVYLTIDRDLQIGIYNLLEQQLAGIITNKLVNRDLEETDYKKGSNIPIPVKGCVFPADQQQCAGHGRVFCSGSVPGGKIHLCQVQPVQGADPFLDPVGAVERRMRLLWSLWVKTRNPICKYIYSYLVSQEVVVRDRIDRDSEAYAGMGGGDGEPRGYLYKGIAENWIDTTKLKMEDKYSDADHIYQILVDYVIGDLETDSEFSKRIYKYLINGGSVTGKELCLALYSQNILAYDEAEVRMLEANGDEYAFQFIRQKISDIEITPAQLALDPCSAGCVVTDVKTGEVRALVTYPSYDNNKFSGTVDAEYYNKLNNDMSLPLFNNATQAQKAPGLHV